MNNEQKTGFAMVDVILGAALFAIVAAFAIPAYLYGQEAALIDGKRQRAAAYAETGLEAIRNIRDDSFLELTPGTFGLATSASGWILGGSSDTDGEFTRRIIIESAGTDKLIAKANVTWKQNSQRDGDLTLETRLSNFAKPVPQTGTASYTVAIDSDWVAGYCATITVTTTSTVPFIWTINADMSQAPFNGTPYNVWNANWSFAAPTLTASGVEANATVSASSSASFGLCANRPSLPIARVGSASNPTDNGTKAGPTTTVGPITNLLNGDLLVIIASYRGNASISMSATGGQNWTAFGERANGTTFRSRIFYAVFNGTWTGTPSVTVGSGTLGLTAVMHAFRNTDPYNPIDTWETSGTFASPANPRNVTISAINTSSAEAMALAFWATADDNSWGLQSLDWANVGGAQYRNLQGSDSSISSAYKTVAATGTTGSVINRQTVNGGDAGNWHIFSIRRR